jgi:hypothetical protein
MRPFSANAPNLERTVERLRRVLTFPFGMHDRVHPSLQT